MSADFKGIGLRIGATLFFAIMVLFIKLLAASVPVGQIVFYRSAIALIPLVIFLIMCGEFPGGLKTKRPIGHISRCVFGCIAMFASFASLEYLPMADATIIGFLAPIITVLLARIFLSEVVTTARWVGVLLGFSGVLLLIYPQLAALELGASYVIGVILGLLMAFFTALAKIQIRSLAQTESAGAIALYFAACCAFAGLLTFPFAWVTTNHYQLALLVGSGITGGVAHIMMTLSYKYSQASKLATFEYSMLGFAAVLDFMFFQIIPQWNFYISATLVLIAAIVVVMEGKNLFTKLQKQMINS
jgi:drug/metabolite transporter (DMT)-like permease